MDSSFSSRDYAHDYSPRARTSPFDDDGDSVGSHDLEDHESLFSPGPTFVDNIDDDMDDERMLVGDDDERQ